MQKIPIALAANGMVLAIGKDLGALPGLGVARGACRQRHHKTAEASQTEETSTAALLHDIGKVITCRSSETRLMIRALSHPIR
jgi:hypothetical protein